MQRLINRKRSYVELSNINTESRTSSTLSLTSLSSYYEIRKTSNSNNSTSSIPDLILKDEKNSKKIQKSKFIKNIQFQKIPRIKNPKVFLLSLILFTVLLSKALLYIKRIWLGSSYSIRGGKLGSLYDRWSQKRFARKSELDKRSTLKNTGGGLMTLENQMFVEKFTLLLEFSKSSLRALQQEELCNSQLQFLIPPFLHKYQTQNKPYLGFLDSNMPAQRRSYSATSIIFPYSFILNKLKQVHLSLYSLYISLSSHHHHHHQEFLCSLVFLYLYGGVFLSSHLVSDGVTSVSFYQISQKVTSCSSHLYLYKHNILIATPKHSILKEIIDEIIGNIDSYPDLTSFLKYDFHHFYFTSLLDRFLTQRKESISSLSQSCYDSRSECILFHDNKPLFKLQYQYMKDNQNKFNSSKLEPTNISSSVMSNKSPKQSIQSILQKNHCEPSWFCNRCLKSYLLGGSYLKCSFVCPSCFREYMCFNHSTFETIPAKVTIGIHFSEKIPKIIHQTWLETPQNDLSRLQNSWKASGYHYNFYNNKDALQFIQDHYPPTFVHVYKTLIPGAFQADFFRYAVLFIYGGIYADIDLLLETTLDTLISNKTFVAARDTVGKSNDYFCLWNGFIASTPGHPFLKKVLEEIVWNVNRRGDLLDLERSICLRSAKKMETWKVRYEPGLLLTGPCALGVAVNQVLNRGLLDGFPLGLYLSNQFGLIQFLSFDKYDLGFFRLSDVDRNLVVATTNLVPSSQLRKGRNDMNSVNHYSEAAKGQWLWGSRFVYRDFHVRNETIEIVTSHLI